MGTQGRQLSIRMNTQRNRNTGYRSTVNRSSGLRILIDGRKLGDGGIGVYIDNLVRGLLAMRRATVRVQLAAGDRAWPVEVADQSVERLQLGVIVRPNTAERFAWHSQVQLHEDNASLYSVDELIGLPRRLPWEEYDVFHTPHFMLPFAVPLPTVVTLHDLIHVQHPERRYYPYIARVLIRSALRRATRVITVSQATYQDVRRMVGDSSRVMRNVRVVSNAVDPFFLEPPLDSNLSQLTRAKRPFFLAVLSNAKQHKGLEDLITAWAAFKDQHARANSQSLSSVRLFIAGLGTDRLAENAALLSRIADREDVVLLGPLSKEELRAWYQAAHAVVVPSRAEGFGLPVIEAHASGTPVIMRPVPALLELVTSSDFVASDMSIDALTAAFTSAQSTLYEGALSKAKEADNVIRRNFAHNPESLRAETAARFDLRDVARATFQVYKEALSELKR